MDIKESNAYNLVMSNGPPQEKPLFCCMDTSTQSDQHLCYSILIHWNVQYLNLLYAEFQYSEADFLVSCYKVQIYNKSSTNDISRAVTVLIWLKKSQ